MYAQKREIEQMKEENDDTKDRKRGSRKGDR